MTRINSAIPVDRLTDEHLLAEHREIATLPYCVEKAIRSGSINRIPPVFCLGKGHVTFFLDKMNFTFKRYLTLREEYLKRGFSPADYSTNWLFVPPQYMQDYNPQGNDRKLLEERITQRITESPKAYWHYKGKAISKQEAINILKKTKL